MSPKNVNLALLAVEEEIDLFLSTSFSGFYQMVFAIPQMRQNLIKYVMGRIEQTNSNMVKFPYFSLEMRLELENYIYGGIEHLLQRNSSNLELFTNSQIDLVDK